MASRIFANSTASGCPFSIPADGTVVVQSPAFNPNGPKVYWWAQSGQVCFWAEPGTIQKFSENPNEPEYGVMTWETAAVRLEALVLGIVKRTSVNYYPEVRRREEKFCSEMAQVIIDAKNQVPPGTDECIRDREARSAKTIIVPSGPVFGSSGR